MKKNKGVPGFELATYRHAHQQQACTLLYTCVACFFFLVGMLSFVVGTYLVCVAWSCVLLVYCKCVPVSYCLLVRQQQRFEQPTLKQTSVLLGCIKNSTISSKRAHCCIIKHTNRGHNLHGRVVKKKKGNTKMKTINKGHNQEEPSFELANFYWIVSWF